jgi:hypothetical protein
MVFAASTELWIILPTWYTMLLDMIKIMMPPEIEPDAAGLAEGEYWLTLPDISLM